MISFAYVSPRKVLISSSRAVQWQFWSLVGIGIGMASASLKAGSDTPGTPDWLSYWPIATSLGLLVFNMGITWQQLGETKRRIECLESTAPDKTVMAERFESMTKDLDAFGLRFENYLNTVQKWTSKVEDAVYDAERSIARLDERLKHYETRR